MDFSANPVDRDSPPDAAGTGSIFGWRAEIPHSL